MNRTADHQKLVDDIQFAVGSQPWARIWPNNTGVGRALDDPDRIIRFGLEGSPDLIGLLDDGRILCIECKTGKARLSKAQRAFRAMIEKFHGVYIEARSVEQVLQALKPEVGGI